MRLPKIKATQRIYGYCCALIHIQLPASSLCTSSWLLVSARWASAKPPNTAAQVGLLLLLLPSG